MKAILLSMKARLAWYEKALAMYTGAKPYENGFDWPYAPGMGTPLTGDQNAKDQYIMWLAGCIHELNNTIDMIEAQTRHESRK